jgi:hypothetical protein
VQRHIYTFYASTVCYALHVCLYDVNYSLHQRQKTVGNLQNVVFKSRPIQIDHWLTVKWIKFSKFIHQNNLFSGWMVRNRQTVTWYCNKGKPSQAVIAKRYHDVIQHRPTRVAVSCSRCHILDGLSIISHNSDVTGSTHTVQLTHRKDHFKKISQICDLVRLYFSSHSNLIKECITTLEWCCIAIIIGLLHRQYDGVLSFSR